jgi:hypothetical protein
LYTSTSLLSTTNFTLITDQSLSSKYLAMSSANPAVAAALTAVESRRAAQRQAELEDLESDLDDDEVSDESDEEEDEYGEELTPAMDAAILRTLRLIRSGKGVYEGEKVIEGEFGLGDLGVG